MAGTLFVVATPIGNLEDLTFRALRVLREVAVVAAEDTRRTGQLLRHFGITSRLISVHAHNEGLKAASVVDHLRRGNSVALVTDAGTPAVSDPGAQVVREVVAAGFRVEPVPGPSAVMAALSAAGVHGSGFSFLGFPPARGKDRTRWFERLNRATREGDVVFFEAPHRVRKTLEQLEIMSYDRIIVFRELTKTYESVYRGSPGSVLRELDVVAGEFTVVVPGLDQAALAGPSASDEEVVTMFCHMTDKRGREAAREVAGKTGRSANQVYELVRRAKA